MKLILITCLIGLFSPLISAWSPTNSYAPGLVECPSEDLVRTADGLSSSEKAWIEKRHIVTDAAMLDYFARANLTDFDYQEFLSNVSLNIGMAFSGGGLRAMLAGGGQFSALDGRTENANTTGLGGLVQASTYITGLSGGSWLVGTLVLNNWTSIEDILEPNSGIWDLKHNLYNPGGLDLAKTIAYWKEIADEVEDKSDSTSVSLTDPWGRMLSSHLIDMSLEESSGYTWSTIQQLDAFVSHDMPFPIFVADGRYPNTKVINLNSTVFEINPFELGSWDPTLEAFTNVKYLGTTTNGGTQVNGSCVAGFDNAGFIMGTSSSLFNAIVNTIDEKLPLKKILLRIIDKLKYDIGVEYNDIAIYEPNPFSNFNTLSTISSSEFLSLVDGGEDGQNIPLYPLLLEERQVDTIFAFDNSADDNNFPNGDALISTYERQFEKQGAGITFPYVPDDNTFLKLNLTKRPTFFGCNASNLTELSLTNIPPLVIYIANRKFSFDSNVSTYKLKYSETEKKSMIKNGYEVASRNNLTLDNEWNACVGCAIIRREQERRGIEQTNQCKRCFQEYCWDGTTVD